MAKSHLSFGSLLCSLVLLALASGAFFAAWSLVEEEITFLSGSRIVEGEVVDHVFIKGSGTGSKAHRSSGGYYPTVRYVTDDGREFQVQSRVGKGSRQTMVEGIKSGKDANPVGSTMRVAYRIDDPEDARTLGFDQQYLFPVLIACIGLMLLMFAVFVFRDGGSDEKEKDSGNEGRWEKKRDRHMLQPLSWEQQLEPGEKVLWRGKPSQGLSFFGGENGTLVLGLVILGFIGFYFYDTLQAGEEPDVSSVMPGIVFGVLLGLSGPVGMNLVRRGTRYALTSYRAIISHDTKVAGFTLYQGISYYPVTEPGAIPSDVRGLKTVNFARLSQRRPFSEGFGKNETRKHHSVSGGNNQTRNPLVGFERIHDADEVLELCKKVQGATQAT
jgi:hypothetical protein